MAKKTIKPIVESKRAPKRLCADPRRTPSDSNASKVPRLDDNHNHNGNNKNPSGNRPDLPPLETSEYRMIKLRNGIKALLISTKAVQNKDPAWTLTFPDMSKCQII